MTAKPLRYTLTILESHLDFMGHVNNAAYFKIFEEARWELITENGFGFKEMKELGVGPVVLEAHIIYKRELRLRQNVIIETEFMSFAKKIANIRQRIVDNGGKLFCQADFKFGLFDTRARKLIAPTPAWVKAMGVFEPDVT